MRHKILWLRLALWIGIIADAYEALRMLFPQFVPSELLFDGGFGYVFARRDSAPLMIGWTALLLWADRKPVARRGVLLLTLIPVVGNFVERTLSANAGYITSEQALWACVLEVIYFALIVFSLWNARDLKPDSQVAQE